MNLIVRYLSVHSVLSLFQFDDVLARTKRAQSGTISQSQITLSENNPSSTEQDAQVVPNDFSSASHETENPATRSPGVEDSVAENKANANTAIDTTASETEIDPQIIEQMLDASSLDYSYSKEATSALLKLLDQHDLVDGTTGENYSTLSEHEINGLEKAQVPMSTINVLLSEQSPEGESHKPDAEAQERESKQSCATADKKSEIEQNADAEAQKSEAMPCVASDTSTTTDIVQIGEDMVEQIEEVEALDKDAKVDDNELSEQSEVTGNDVQKAAESIMHEGIHLSKRDETKLCGNEDKKPTKYQEVAAKAVHDVSSKNSATSEGSESATRSLKMRRTTCDGSEATNFCLVLNGTEPKLIEMPAQHVSSSTIVEDGARQCESIEPSESGGKITSMEKETIRTLSTNVEGNNGNSEKAVSGLQATRYLNEDIPPPPPPRTPPMESCPPLNELADFALDSCTDTPSNAKFGSMQEQQQGYYPTSQTEPAAHTEQRYGEDTRFHKEAPRCADNSAHQQQLLGAPQWKFPAQPGSSQSNRNRSLRDSRQYATGARSLHDPVLYSVGKAVDAALSSDVGAGADGTPSVSSFQHPAYELSNILNSQNQHPASSVEAPTALHRPDGLGPGRSEARQASHPPPSADYLRAHNRYEQHKYYGGNHHDMQHATHQTASHMASTSGSHLYAPPAPSTPPYGSMGGNASSGYGEGWPDISSVQDNLSTISLHESLLSDEDRQRIVEISQMAHEIQKRQWGEAPPTPLSQAPTVASDAGMNDDALRLRQHHFPREPSKTRSAGGRAAQAQPQRRPRSISTSTVEAPDDIPRHGLSFEDRARRASNAILQYKARKDGDAATEPYGSYQGEYYAEDSQGSAHVIGNNVPYGYGMPVPPPGTPPGRPGNLQVNTSNMSISPQQPPSPRAYSPTASQHYRAMEALEEAEMTSPRLRSKMTSQPDFIPHRSPDAALRRLKGAWRTIQEESELLELQIVAEERAKCVEAPGSVEEYDSQSKFFVFGRKPKGGCVNMGRQTDGLNPDWLYRKVDKDLQEKTNHTVNHQYYRFQSAANQRFREQILKAGLDRKKEDCGSSTSTSLYHSPDTDELI